MFGYKNRFESGAIVVGGKHLGSTVQCVHCGSHEHIIPGSGRKRGHCRYCQGFLCGKKICLQHCIPYEARIEYEEALFGKKDETIKKILNRYPALNKLTF